jgi:single-strand DNA-binding protein
VNLNVATNESWKDDAGKKHERVEWHRVVVFNERIGAVLQKHVRKGQLVRIVGKMRTRKWDDKGTERYTTEVIVDFAGELTLLAPSSDQSQERAA